MLSAISMLLSGGLKAFTEYRKGKTEVAKAKIEKEVAQEKAKAQRALRQVEVAADWDIRAMEDAKDSLKDEILLFIIFAPVVWGFIEAGTVQEGWRAMAEMPWWYPWVILGIIARVYAIRWVVEPIINIFKKVKGPK